MDAYFEINTPNNLIVTTTYSYWQKIITFKHPSMRDEEDKVKESLTVPDQIRESKKDPQILLFYKDYKLYYICVVVKVINGRGFIVTTYMTEKIKEGILKWQK